MRYVWEPDDIKAGLMYWRPHDFGSAEDIGYTLTVCYKIGYCGECRNNQKDQKQYVTLSFLTDGCVYGHGTKEEIAKHLNETQCAPLDTDTLLEILKRYKQER